MKLMVDSGLMLLMYVIRSHIKWWTVWTCCYINMAVSWTRTRTHFSKTRTRHMLDSLQVSTV